MIEGPAHGELGPLGGGGHHVAAAVRGHPVAAQGAQDRGAPGLGPGAGLEHEDAGALGEDEAGPVGGVRARGPLGPVVVPRGVGAHRVEPGVEVDVRDVHAARERRVHVAALHEPGREEEVVGAPGAGRGGGEGRAGRPEDGSQVRGDGRGHEAGDDGRRHLARSLRPAQPRGHLAVRRHVAGAAAHDDGQVARRDPRLPEREPRRAQGQERRPAHEARLRLLDPEALGREIARVEADELALRALLDRRRPARERRGAPLAQRRLDGRPVVAHVAGDAGAGDDHLARAISHVRSVLVGRADRVSGSS